MEPDDKLYVKDIQPGDGVETEFLLDDLRLGQTKNGKPFVGLKVKDRSGALEARVWDRADAFYDLFKNGDVALVRGQAESYLGSVQIKVVDARLVDPERVDYAKFLASSPYDPDDMLEELAVYISEMTDPHMKGLMKDFLADKKLIAAFSRAPAAKRFHHAYISGLLEHTLGMVRTARAVAKLYPVLNADLLLCGAVWHDMGKVREFEIGGTGDYTDEGRLLGHMTIAISLLDEKLAARPDFPEMTAMLLKHLILSHHGEYEMGSPRRPKILEALALHMIDDLDAKMNAIGGFIERHADESGWTDYNRLMTRFFFKPPHWEADQKEQTEKEPEEDQAEPADGFIDEDTLLEMSSDSSSDDVPTEPEIREEEIADVKTDSDEGAEPAVEEDLESATETPPETALESALETEPEEISDKEPVEETVSDDRDDKASQDEKKPPSRDQLSLLGD